MTTKDWSPVSESKQPTTHVRALLQLSGMVIVVPGTPLPGKYLTSVLAAHMSPEEENWSTQTTVLIPDWSLFDTVMVSDPPVIPPLWKRADFQKKTSIASYNFVVVSNAFNDTIADTQFG